MTPREKEKYNKMVFHFMATLLCVILILMMLEQFGITS